MRFLFIAPLLTTLMFTSCATLKPMELQPDFWQQSNKKVAVVVHELPKSAAYKAGNQGLLDVAINNAISNKFDNFIESLQFEPYSALAEDIEKEFDQRGFDATVVKLDPKNIPALEKTAEQKKNPALFQMNLGAVPDLKDKDLVFIITSNQVGTTRSYYGFVPTSAPQGLYGGIAHLVDVKTNEIKWWKPVNVVKPVSGKWDQPPSYPNVSQAVDLAVEASKQEYKKQFFNKAISAPAVVN